MIVTVYTDGSCIPNPGRGGWAWVIADESKTFGSGNENPSTNQRMEMRAVIEALRSQPERVPVIIKTDSQFVIKGATQWINKWRVNGWITGEGKPVKNRELWEDLWTELGRRVVKFEWVRGHNGDKWNEYVDLIANDATGASEEDRAEMSRRIGAQKSKPWGPPRGRRSRAVV